MNTVLSWAPAVALPAVILTQCLTFADPFAVNRALFALFGVGAGLLLFCSGENHSGRSPLHPAVIAVMALAAVGAWITPSAFRRGAADELVRVFAFAGFFFVTFAATRAARDIDRIRRTLFIVTAIACGYAILQYHNLDFVARTGNPLGSDALMGTLANKSFFSSFLTYIFPWVVYHALAAKGPSRFIHAALAAMMAWILYTSSTRSAWLGTAGFLAAALWLECRHGRIRALWQNSRTAVLACIAAALIAAIVGWALAPERLRSRVASIGQTHSGTNLARLYMWWGSAEMLRDRPLAGQGTGAFVPVFQHFQPGESMRYGVQNFTLHAHSEPAQILAEQGLAGIAAWSALALIALAVGYSRFARESDPQIRSAAAGIALGLLAGLINDAIQPTLRLPYNGLVFAVYMGLLARLAGMGGEGGGRHATCDMRHAERGERRATCDMRHAESDMRHAACKIGRAACVGRYAAAVVIIGAVAVTQVRQLMADKMEWTLGGNWEHERASALAEKLLELDPNRPALLDRLFDAYVQRGEYDSAERTARRLFAFMPSFLTKHDYARHLWERGMAVGDADALRRAILDMEWMASIDDGIEYHVNLGIMHRQAGDSARSGWHGLAAGREVDRDRVYFARVHPAGPGESIEFYPASAGKGVYGYLPGRFDQGLKDALVMRLLTSSPESHSFAALAHQLAGRVPGQAEAHVPAVAAFGTMRNSAAGEIWVINTLSRIIKRGGPREGLVVYRELLPMLTRPEGLSGDRGLDLYLAGLITSSTGEPEIGIPLMAQALRENSAAAPFLKSVHTSIQ